MEKKERKKNQRKKFTRTQFRGYRQAAAFEVAEPVPSVALFAYVARGGGGRRAGRQALMPMHHAYSNLLPPPPWHGTAVHGS